MILRGDARAIPLADESVNCVVTSPPYWGLRDYGEQGQLGLEPTPEEYVTAMVGVFREVWRVLRADGTLWLNLGDSYIGNASPGGEDTRTCGTPNARDTVPSKTGLPAKNLVGIPWRVAFALQADGWILRSDIIWAKKNPMPESVRDRPTKSHEHLFLLAKSPRYYWDQDAVREPALQPIGVPRQTGQGKRKNADPGAGRYQNNLSKSILGSNQGSPFRNIRDVWTIATQPYPGAHFAVMPPALVEPCIKAGCPEGGIVLDPFMGAGTVGLVADRLRRRWVGLELSQEYARMARDRIYDDCPLFAGIGA